MSTNRFITKRKLNSQMSAHKLNSQMSAARSAFLADPLIPHRQLSLPRVIRPGPRPSSSSGRTRPPHLTEPGLRPCSSSSARSASPRTHNVAPSRASPHGRQREGMVNPRREREKSPHGCGGRSTAARCLNVEGATLGSGSWTWGSSPARRQGSRRRKRSCRPGFGVVKCGRRGGEDERYIGWPI